MPEGFVCVHLHREFIERGQAALEGAFGNEPQVPRFVGACAESAQAGDALEEDVQPDDERYTITFYVAPEGTSVVDVTAADNSTTISVPEGGAVLVDLDENPTTGYQWNASVSGNARITIDSFIAPYSETPLVGAGGYHKWLVTFDGEPSGTFDAVYARPWEEPAEDADSFTITFA